MSVSHEERLAFFELELNLIYDPSIREFTSLCLMAAPEYFFVDCPASSSGKYHPLDELGWDGTIVHTRKVASVAYDLCRGLGCEDNRDLIISACIIHDLRKQGVTSERGHTVKHHPHLASELVTEVHYDTQILSEPQFEMVRTCCGYHYGPWSINPWRKPLTEFTQEELCVYLSDYIASRKSNTINYLTREW